MHLDLRTVFLLLASNISFGRAITLFFFTNRSLGPWMPLGLLGALCPSFIRLSYGIPLYLLM
jgi:hypothetical protein